MLLRLASFVALSALVMGCAAARLEPAPGAQRVPNKPKAAAAEHGGVKLIAEADAWRAPDNVRDEVTALKVTVVNHGREPLAVEYSAFQLVSSDGEAYATVKPEDITIRSGSRSIGLPADAMISRGSNSSTGLGPDSPYRSEEEKTEIRQQLVDRSLASGELKPGERVTGYVYFERVPATKTNITLKSTLTSAATGQVIATADIPFQVRKTP